MSLIAAKTEPSPWPQVLLLTVSMFLLVGGRLVLVMLKPLVAISARMQGYERSSLDELFVPIATLILAPALVVAYGQLSRRFNRLRVTAILGIVYVSGLAAAYSLAAAGIDGGHGFAVWLDFSSLLVVHLWAVTADIFSSSAGKRVLGVIASGGTLAGLAFLAWSLPVVNHVGLDSRLTTLGVCIAALLALALTGVAATKSPVSAAAAGPPGARNGFGLLLHDTNVRRIASLVAASCCVSWLLEERVPSTLTDPWTSMGGSPMLALLLIVQIGLLPLLLPRLSVRWTLFVAPALALVQIGLLLSLPAAQSTLPARIAASIGSTWGSVAIVALFLSASRNAKYDGQIMMFLLATVIGRGCGAIITGSLAFSGASALWLTLAPLVPIAFWVWLAVGTGRHVDELAPVK